MLIKVMSLWGVWRWKPCRLEMGESIWRSFQCCQLSIGKHWEGSHVPCTSNWSPQEMWRFKSDQKCKIPKFCYLQRPISLKYQICTRTIPFDTLVTRMHIMNHSHPHIRFLINLGGGGRLVRVYIGKLKWNSLLLSPSSSCRPIMMTSMIEMVMIMVVVIEMVMIMLMICFRCLCLFSGGCYDRVTPPDTSFAKWECVRADYQIFLVFWYWIRWW